MSSLKDVKYEDILDILNKLDTETHIPEFTQVKEDSTFVGALASFFDDGRYLRHAVLGIDIYRYSKYTEYKQLMIPVLFKLLYDDAVRECIKHEQFLFQHFDANEFSKKFVSTGDGGFQIFPTPLHAFVFSIYFEAGLRTFNSFSKYPKLRSFLGEISLRYAMTLDQLFHFDNNFFGPAIINNSRILSKDTLNRYLIDKNTFDWFLNKIAGIESLVVTTLATIANQSEFSSYDKKKLDGENMLIPSYPNKTNNNIRQINVQKIGLLDTKGATFDIHSIFVQVFLILYDEKNPAMRKPFVFSLGNTNSSGI